MYLVHCVSNIRELGEIMILATASCSTWGQCEWFFLGGWYYVFDRTFG